VARLIFIDLVGSLFWFPVWWYTTGLVKVVNAAQSAMSYRIKSYGLKIWIKNFFVPMYGQFDLTGRLVSVFMRTVVLIGRLVALAVEAVVYALGVVVWLAAPAAFLLLAIVNLTQVVFTVQTGTLI
jgi:hypothetical protein